MLVKGNGSREEWCRGSRVRVGMRFGPVPFAEDVVVVVAVVAGVLAGYWLRSVLADFWRR